MLFLSLLFQFIWMLQARHQVPEVVLQQIRSLNQLDLELYKYAQDIFAKQHGRTKHKFRSTVSLFVPNFLHPKYLFSAWVSYVLVGYLALFLYDVFFYFRWWITHTPTCNFCSNWILEIDQVVAIRYFFFYDNLEISFWLGFVCR